MGSDPADTWMRALCALAGLYAAACGARSGLDPGRGAAAGYGFVDAGTDGSGGAGASGGTGGTRSRLVSVVVGDARSCVLTSSGEVRCWGANGRGAAGYAKGLCEDPPIPCTDTCCIGDDEKPGPIADRIDVGGKVTQLSAGTTHTCALLEGGRVRCWGNAASGSLGYGNNDDIGDDEPPSAAGDVDVGGTVIEVAVGSGTGAHTCALLGGGRVRCWGYGAVGELGYANTADIGDNESPASAGDVAVGGPVTQIVAGEGFSCALLVSGTVRCWGLGTRGRLGYGNIETIGDNESPAAAGDVDVGGTVVRLAAGSGRHVCALLNTGRVRCWGYGASGQLGYGNTENIGDDETPASAGDVALPGPVTQIAVGGDRTCAVLDSGALVCWGSNYHGELGIPTLKTGCFSCLPGCCLGDDELLGSASPIDVGGPVLQVAVGRFHVCALLTTGNVRCWGSGEYGELGYGNTDTIGDDEPPSAAGDVAVF